MSENTDCNLSYKPRTKVKKRIFQNINLNAKFCVYELIILYMSHNLPFPNVELVNGTQVMSVGSEQPLYGVGLPALGEFWLEGALRTGASPVGGKHT